MLQTFIDNNTNYVKEFKKNNLFMKVFDNLLLVKYKYNFNYNLTDKPWIKYCKSSIIDIKNNKVLFISPIKSIKINHLLDISTKGNLMIEELHDGVMINLFYYNNDWNISTRSNIGGDNKWITNKSFKDMIYETDFNYEKLDINSNYSFVLKHKDIQIVSPVHKNEMVLIEKNNKSCLDEIDNIIYDKPYHFKGYSIRDLDNNIRYSLINPAYIEVKSLNYNTNNMNELFLYLHRNNKLNQYFKYFPNKKELLIDIKNKYYTFISYIHKLYINLYINKKEINYNKKYIPLINEIHLYHKSNNISIYKNILIDILNNYPIKLLYKLF